VTIFAIILLAYLFVAPDKGTLAATRGTEGAFRAVLGMPPRQRRAAKGSSPKASGGNKKANGPKGSRSILDGWREGVASARVAREEGRDVWARTSRGAGKVAGGTRNVVGGIRTTVQNRRDRRNPGSSVEPDAQTTVIDPTTTTDPVTRNPDQTDDGTDRRPADAVKEGDDTPQDGRLLFSSITDDLGAAIGGSAQPQQKAGELDDVDDNQIPDLPVGEEPLADDRYYPWESPESGQYFVFDRLNLDEPMPCRNERDADLISGFYNDRHGLATQNGEAPAALAEIPESNSADQISSKTPQTPTADPAAGDTTRKEPTPMSIAGTDLANLDEVDGEAKAALNAIEALTEALSEIKGWGGNLPDRWSGTSWGTDGLDSAIAGVAEAASELQIPEALLEHLAAIGQEIAKARTVGEAAAEVRAKGDLAAFGAN
jgi:hypothetical protein